MGDEVVERGTAVERFRGAITPKTDQVDVRRPHKAAFAFTGQFDTDSLMVEVCFVSGEFLAFDANSSPMIAYVPGTVLILYPTAIVEIEGRNLAMLVSYLKQHRISYIQEAHNDYASEDEAYIDTINLHDPAGWEEMVTTLCGRMQKIKRGKNE